MQTLKKRGQILILSSIGVFFIVFLSISAISAQEPKTVAVPECNYTGNHTTDRCAWGTNTVTGCVNITGSNGNCAAIIP